MIEKTIVFPGRNIRLSNSGSAVLIAGNCVIENEKQAFETAFFLKKAAAKAGIKLIYKASYDKANRSSIKSFRGPGIARGLAILREVKKAAGVILLVDVHSKEEVPEAACVADILQVPAFLCRQTDLLLACAETGLPVNVKKGQFLAPEDMGNIVGKIRSAGNSKVILTERGASFGYHNLVADMRSLEIMKSTGCPVIFDATHSAQLPGGLGKSSGGQKEYVLTLAKAAAAVGVAGIYVEVHKNPKKALSDGPNSLSFADVPGFLKIIKKIDQVVKL